MNDAWPILAIVAPVVTGWFAVGAVAGDQLRAGWARLFRFAAGAGVGFAIASGAYFLWRVAGLQHGVAYRLVDCLVLPVVATVAYLVSHRRKSELNSRLGEHSASTVVLVILSLLVASFAIAASVRLALAEPLGNWDANAIWNLKAR